MIKKVLQSLTAFSLLLLSGQAVMAQETAPADTTAAKVEGPWDRGGVFSLNLSQAAFSNWANGGESSVSGTALIDTYLNYNSDKESWESNFKMAYGLMQREDIGTQKTDDMIKLSSKYGRKLHKHWFYSAMLNFKTQFAPGYETPGDENYISNFFAPAYAVYSLGFDYKPKKNFTVFLAPLTGKTTYVADQELANAGAYGLTPAIYDNGVLIADASNFRHEFGGYVNIAYQRKVMENIQFNTKLNLFSNYIKKAKNIDVDWEVLIAMKVNKYISANISTHMIYDDDIMIAETDTEGNVISSSPKLQFKEVLGIGLSYNF